MNDLDNVWIMLGAATAGLGGTLLGTAGGIGMPRARKGQRPAAPPLAPAPRPATRQPRHAAETFPAARPPQRRDNRRADRPDSRRPTADHRPRDRRTERAVRDDVAETTHAARRGPPAVRRRELGWLKGVWTDRELQARITALTSFITKQGFEWPQLSAGGEFRRLGPGRSVLVGFAAATLERSERPFFWGLRQLVAASVRDRRRDFCRADSIPQFGSTGCC